MEKRTRHCKLAVVMDLIAAGKVRITGISHAARQDVYRPRTPAGEVYLNLTVLDDLLIVSFKVL